MFQLVKSNIFSDSLRRFQGKNWQLAQIIIWWEAHYSQSTVTGNNTEVTSFTLINKSAKQPNFHIGHTRKVGFCAFFLCVAYMSCTAPGGIKRYFYLGLYQQTAPHSTCTNPLILHDISELRKQDLGTCYSVRWVHLKLLWNQVKWTGFLKVVMFHHSLWLLQFVLF